MPAGSTLRLMETFGLCPGCRRKPAGAFDHSTRLYKPRLYRCFASRSASLTILAAACPARKSNKVSSQGLSGRLLQARAAGSATVDPVSLFSPGPLMPSSMPLRFKHGNTACAADICLRTLHCSCRQLLQGAWARSRFQSQS